MIRYTVSAFTICLLLSACSKKTVVGEPSEVTTNTKIEAKPSETKTMVEDRLDQMIAVIGLNEKKANKFKAIEKKYQEKRLALRDEKIDQMVKLEKARSLMSSMDAEYEEMMNDEEYKRYRAIVEAKLQKSPANQ